MSDGFNENVTANVSEAGDLHYKVFVDGQWKRRNFPLSMLIRFDSISDFKRAMDEKRIDLTLFENPR